MRHLIFMTGMLMFLASCSSGTIYGSDAAQDGQGPDDSISDDESDGSSISDSLDASSPDTSDSVSDASDTNDAIDESDDGDHCQAATCESVGAKCGTIDNLCGSTIECDNNCTNLETCVGNQCQCLYLSCSSVCCSQGEICHQDSGGCCSPTWQDLDACDCVAGPCAGCNGSKTQTDGCGNQRIVACSLEATGCATFCCQTTCVNPDDPQNCGSCGLACDEGFICQGTSCTATDMRGADEVYFVHPWITDQIDDRIRGSDDTPPLHKFVIMMWQMGPTAEDTIVTWSVGDRTGFYPSAVDGETFQRGPNNLYDSTAAQMHANEVGIYINTASQAYTGNILPIVASHDWPVSQDLRPWRNPGSALSYSFSLQVPTAVRSGQLQLYITPVFALRDAVHNVSFWMTAQIFDPRGAGSSENILCDCCSTCTKAMIIMSTITRGMQWSHPTMDSSAFSDTTWSGYRYVEYRVSYGEFAKAINTLADSVGPSGVIISRQPEDYQLVHFNFNPETSTMIGPGDGQLGLSVRDIRIARYRAVYDTVRIGIANGGPDSELQVFFKTEGDAGFSEPKSVLITFPANGGAWVELAANLGSNSLYRGTITGLRIDPFNANQPFGIDYVYVCSRDAANHVNDCIRAWDFDNGPNADGWTLSGIGNLWINNPGDEGHWGGVGTNGDPFFYTGTDFDCGQ